MLVDVQKFLDYADIKEALYPGKRLVKPCKQIGQYKNHCVVLDWRDPDVIRIDIKPGISGKHLAPEVVKEYPVCFQTPTYVKIEVVNDNADDDDDEGEEGKSKGKSDGGGKQPAKKKLEDIEKIAARFSKSVEGAIPSLGKIKEMVVMGMQIAKEGFAIAFAELTRQIQHAKISATEILAKSADLVTKVTPPAFLKPSGDETVTYKYDREKNADIGVGMNPSLG
jgi:hypothetical protein